MKRIKKQKSLLEPQDTAVGVSVPPSPPTAGPAHVPVSVPRSIPDDEGQKFVCPDCLAIGVDRRAASRAILMPHGWRCLCGHLTPHSEEERSRLESLHARRRREHDDWVKHRQVLAPSRVAPRNDDRM